MSSIVPAGAKSQKDFLCRRIELKTVRKNAKTGDASSFVERFCVDAVKGKDLSIFFKVRMEADAETGVEWVVRFREIGEEFFLRICHREIIGEHPDFPHLL